MENTRTEEMIINLASMSISELVEYYVVTGEIGGETESRETRDYCSRQLTVIEAIADMKFPGEFRPALVAA